MGPTKRSYDRMQSCGAAPAQCTAGTPNKSRSPGVNRNVTFSTQSPSMSQFNGSREFTSQNVNAPLVSDQLPDNEKLVNTKEFQITGTSMGKYLACGEKVYVYPDRNEFRIRILNMDYKSGRGLRNYVEFSKASLDELIRHASEIERLVGGKLTYRHEVFQHMGLYVSIYQDGRTGSNGIEFRSDNCYSQMVIGTFRSLVNFKEQVDREYYLFERKLVQDVAVYEKVLNMFAYLANENRSNTVGVEEPSETNKNAITNTCKTLLKQMGKLVQKEMECRENNN